MLIAVGLGDAACQRFDTQAVVGAIGFIYVGAVSVGLAGFKAGGAVVCPAGGVAIRAC